MSNEEEMISVSKKKLRSILEHVQRLRKALRGEIDE